MFSTEFASGDAQTFLTEKPYIKVIIIKYYNEKILNSNNGLPFSFLQWTRKRSEGGKNDSSKNGQN